MNKLKVLFMIAVLFLSIAGGAGAEFVLPGFGISSLEELVESISEQIAEKYKQSEWAKDGKKPYVFLNKNYFADPHTGNIYPFSSFLAVELKKSLMDKNIFNITDDPASNADLVIGGDYYRENKKLVVALWLNGIKIDKDTGVVSQVAGGREELKAKYLDSRWFEESVSNRMLFLMRKLEAKSEDKLAFQESRPNVQVQKFTYQKSRLYSPFSDYIGQFVFSFLTESNLLMPITELDAASRINKYKAGTRSIIPTKTKGGTIAKMSGASHYITGSYWKVTGDEIEVQVALVTKAGEVLASDSALIPVSMLNPELLKLPQQNDAGFMKDYNSFVANADGSNPNAVNKKEVLNDTGQYNVEVFTQKGKSNIKFLLGETVTFYIKTNQASYIRIFNRTSAGQILQIFPNSFAPGGVKVEANMVVPIPEASYDFEFTVGEPVGNELIKVFASNEPLPELPSQDLQYHGIRLINLTAEEIQQKYTEYALSKGIKLAQDLIAVTTAHE